MSDNFVIKAEKVSFAYDQNSPVLREISFHVRAGESVGIIGANGAGKSTLFQLLTGLLPHQGDLQVAGLPVEKAHLAAIRAKEGFVFQDSENQLFMPTVLDDLTFGPLNYGMSPEEAEAAADEALERLQIAHLKHRQNYRLSGGEKRLVCLAAVLAMKPEILLMDEPSITLDPVHRRNLIEILNGMGETKLIASHDLDMIMETCERVMVISEGKICADGPAREILQDQALLASCHLELPYCLQQPHWK